MLDVRCTMAHNIQHRISNIVHRTSFKLTIEQYEIQKINKRGTRTS